ncbi:MAG: response regulator [Gemmatimonadetes bacterium]|nr:response regulator [Gemmatimonadota bacterium]
MGASLRSLHDLLRSRGIPCGWRSPRKRMTLPDGLHVLLVEDRAGERWLMAEILRSRGHMVTACEASREALAAWKTHRHPLVVLDCDPGGRHGRRLLPGSPCATGGGAAGDPSGHRKGRSGRARGDPRRRGGRLPGEALRCSPPERPPRDRRERGSEPGSPSMRGGSSRPRDRRDQGAVREPEGRVLLRGPGGGPADPGLPLRGSRLRDPGGRLYRKGTMDEVASRPRRGHRPDPSRRDGGLAGAEPNTGHGSRFWIQLPSRRIG